MNELWWAPIVFVAIIAIPAALGVGDEPTSFRSFRERMTPPDSKKRRRS